MSAVVGIDVGAYKHAVAVCRSGEGEAERGVFRLSADRSGFNELDRWLERQGPVERVVLESSGHYYWPLASHLHRRGYGVAVVNPLQAKYFAKSRLQRSKSDPADARTLAALGMSEEPRIKDPLLGAEAKEAARVWGGLVKEQGQLRQKLLRLGEVGFPELKECFEDPLCDTALAVLREAPTARTAARRRVSTLAETKRPGGLRRLGESKAGRLHELAKQTIAPPELDAQMGFEVRMLIQQFDRLDSRSRLPSSRRPKSLTPSSLGDCRRFPAWDPRWPPLSSPRSGTSGASKISTSSPATPESIPRSRAQAPRARSPRPAGTWPRRATPTFAQPPTKWPSSEPCTTQSSVLTTFANELTGRVR